jgi:hypothetical protein
MQAVPLASATYWPSATRNRTPAATQGRLRVVGWEEWELDADLQVTASRGWFDADYARQTGAGA